MNPIKNAKSSKIKLMSTPRKNQNIVQNNKFKGEIRTKINNYINAKKNLLIKINENNSLTPLTIKNYPEKKCVFSSENNLNQENYNLLNEISTKANDSSGEEKLGRKIQIQNPLNLQDKFNKIKNLLEKNLKLTLNLTLMNNIINKPYTKYNKNYLIEENKKRNKNNEIKKAIINKDSNYKNEHNFLNKKILTEHNYQIKADKNLYKQHSKNNLDNNNNIIFVKHKSCNLFKTALFNNNKNINLNAIQDNKNIKNKENKSFHYIKVNKKKENTDNHINNKENESININKNNTHRLYNSINLNNKINITRNKNLIKAKSKAFNTEIIDKKVKNQIFTKKKEKKNKPNNNNIPTNKNEKSESKTIKNLDKNKLEHNIFLDKTYQNRFKKMLKNKNKTNDIFTSDKQKEYNNFIVKKKSNYLRKQIINRNNCSDSNNEKNKNWVYRLYNQEINKQKIKDKMILKLRKSILNEEKIEKSQFPKSKTAKQFKSNKYKLNERYNIDDNFDIINLFLSDEKKRKKKNMIKKRKRIKKLQSFHTYRNRQQRRYSFDDNKITDEKMGKLIEDKICLKNHRSLKKFRFLYDQELIDEEDEEKENDDDDEDEQ